MSQKDLQASIAGGTLVRSMAHNMTVLQKYRGAMMDVITSFVNTPTMTREGRRQRRWPTRSRRRSSPPSAAAPTNLARGGRSSLERERNGERSERGVAAVRKPAPGRDMLTAWTPRLVILPSAVASFIYVFVFTRGRSTSRCRTARCCRPTTSSACKPIFRPVVEPALDDRLRQSLLLQRLLRRLGARHRPRAGDRDRPAGQRRSVLANDLPLSARRLVRRHRHGLELALQPQRRHRIPRAQPRLDEFHLPPDHEQEHRDLRDHRHRHLAVVGLRDGAVSRRPALGRSRTSSRRRRSTARVPAASIAR